jgi:hypothetical protein
VRRRFEQEHPRSLRPVHTSKQKVLFLFSSLAGRCDGDITTIPIFSENGRRKFVCSQKFKILLFIAGRKRIIHGKSFLCEIVCTLHIEIGFA